MRKEQQRAGNGRRSLCGMVLFLMLAPVANATPSPVMPESQPPINLPNLMAARLKAPMSFEANQGQTDQSVNFIARGSGYTVFLMPTEAVMVLQQREPQQSLDNHDPLAPTEPAPIKQSVVRMKLGEANPIPSIEGREKLPGIVNYFIGNDPAKWRTKIPTYAKVNYQEVYPGIDVAYYGNQGRLEYDFIVASGADPNQIKLSFEGASDIRITRSGDLLLSTAVGEIMVQKPVVYQRDDDGHKTLIAGDYLITSDEVGIRLAAYDRGRTLIIDPTIIYGTYLGGSGFDHAFAIAVDSSGNAYVTGGTQSLNFPVTAGSFQATLGPHEDAFVAKLDSSGSALVYATYLGGSGGDQAFSIAVDASGNAYVTGRGSAAYPTTPGAYQTTFAGGDTDAFVTKLNPTGSGLAYSTFIGGPGVDVGAGIQVDGVGDAYITGNAGAAGFPTTGGAFQTVFGGGPNGDAFVAKINAAGSALLYSTFLGGNSEDSGSAIALDALNNAYVTGFTSSGNYPTTPGALQTIPQGGHDAFVSKVNSSGSALLYSTYIGGNSLDRGSAIAVDSSNNAFVAGYTSSANFPVTGGVVQPLLAGAPDVFIIKLNASGTGLMYSTYLGGSGVEGGTGLLGAAADAGGNAYVVGRTNSMNFPTSNAFQAALGGSVDAFVTKLNPTATAFIYSSYLGGNGDDDARSVTLGASGSVYITGSTFSTNFPTTTGSLRTTTAGGGDGYVVRISDRPIANAGPDQSVPEGTLVTLDGTGSTGGSLTHQWTQVSGPSVALSAASSAHPTFAAPHVPAAGATLTFQLIVCEGTSSNCSDPDTVNVHIINVNQPPVSQAGPDQTVQEGSPVLLDGTASYDPDIEAISYHWLQVFGPPVTLANPLTATPSFTAPAVGAGGAQVDFELIVTDPHGLNHSDYVSVFITNVNQPPVANAGLDQTKNEHTLVTLDGSASHDPDLDFLTYSWGQTGGPLVALTGANSINPTFTAPEVSPGGALLTFQLTVHDGHVSSAADSVQIAVVNVNDPPVCTLAQASPNRLWPPNHTMTQVNIVGLSDPNNQSLTVTYTAVMQDEPVNGLGDGDMSPDAAVAGNSILLRAERAGTGNGRIYVVHFTATDTEGASCSSTVRVSVPHSKKDPAVENQQLYNSFGP